RLRRGDGARADGGGERRRRPPRPRRRRGDGPARPAARPGGAARRARAGARRRRPPPPSGSGRARADPRALLLGRGARRDDGALPGGGGLTSVEFHAPPGVGRTIGYQKYYLLGFEEAARLRVRGLPPVPFVRAKVALAYRLGRRRGGEAWVG